MKKTSASSPANLLLHESLRRSVHKCRHPGLLSTVMIMFKCSFVTFNTWLQKFHTKHDIMNTAIPMLIRRRIGEKWTVTLHSHTSIIQKKCGGLLLPQQNSTQLKKTHKQTKKQTLNSKLMAQVTYSCICFAAVHENSAINNNINIQNQHTQR